MKKIILFVLISLLSTNLQSQIFKWVKREGLYAHDLGYGVANDTSGNVYLVGKYEMHANFSDTIVPFQGNHDIFVAKYTSEGKLTWIRTAGGYSGDYARAVACDGKNYLYVTGEIQGLGAIINFDGSPIKLNTLGDNDIFVAKYDLNGNLLWAKSAGSPKVDEGFGITYNAAGDVYVCGFFNDKVNFGTISLTSAGGYDMFIAKYDATGNFKWAKKYGSTGKDEARSIKCDPSGNIYVCGEYTGKVTFGSQSITAKGGSDAFLAKYDPNGTLIWIKSMGGRSGDEAWGLTMDNAGKIYLAGEFSSSATFGAFSLTSSGQADIFVACYDASGNALWAKRAGGTGTDRARAIGTDGTNFFITGQYGSTSASFGATTLHAGDLLDVYMAKLDNAGNFKWATAVGGPVDVNEIYGFEAGTAICAEPSGNVYAAGAIVEGGIFGNITINKYDHSDIFLAKMEDTVTASFCKIPSGLIADSIKAESVILRWTTVSNSLSYNVQYRIKGTDTWTTQNTNTNSVALAALTSSTNYEFHVKAICSSNMNNYSEVVTFTTATSGTGIIGIIPAGSFWKYLDNGTNQGTAWRTTAFDDSTWKTGKSEFGYGEGDESTVVAFGTDATNKYITTYFRKTFTIDLLSKYSSFALKLLKDDGAVVYINGIEAVRSNMPSGTLTSSTLALTGISGAEETVFTNYILDPSKFVTGVNTIAVEIHQNYAGSPDLSFNLMLNANAALVSSCMVPLNLNASVTENSATLFWSAVSNALSYDVRYRKVGTTAWTTLNINSNSILIAGLSALANYEFQVRAVCSSAVSDYSSGKTFVTTGTGITGLITVGASWKYLDNGINQGTAWKEISFNDTTWKNGNSELGYGDSGESTVVGFGADATNKYITTYFRKTFSIDILSKYSSIELKLLRDDGAVVYINGAEALRSNMPSGTIINSTLALTAISGADETAFTSYILDPSKFVTRVNTIAVEVHQNFGGSADMSFNLSLNANAISLFPCGTPANLNALVAANSTTLTWSAVPEALSYDVQYRISGTTNWTTLNTIADSAVISGLTPSSNYEFRVRTVCSSAWSAYSVVATFITSADAASSILIPASSSWKYLDNGTDQGTAWRTALYNDSTWKSGNAEFGYGEGDEATVVNYGTSSTNKFITTYFRKTFDIADTSGISALELSLIKDDGAVVYINGIEVYRSNLPTGTMFFNTLAPTVINGLSESTYEIANISSAALVNGSNLIAVEIHQNAVTSADISFNLKLKAIAGIKMKETVPFADDYQQTNFRSNNYDMIVYPNPTTGQFNLEFCIDDLQEKTLVIEVSNTLSQVVYKNQPKKINGCVKEVIALDASLPLGIYLMKVTIGDKVETKNMLLVK